MKDGSKQEFYSQSSELSNRKSSIGSYKVVFGGNYEKEGYDPASDIIFQNLWDKRIMKDHKSNLRWELIIQQKTSFFGAYSDFYIKLDRLIELICLYFRLILQVGKQNFEILQIKAQTYFVIVEDLQFHNYNISTKIMSIRQESFKDSTNYEMIKETQQGPQILDKLIPENSAQAKHLFTFLQQMLQIHTDNANVFKRYDRFLEYEQLQPRDRKVIIKLPNDNGELSEQSLQSYTTELCNTAWSRAFNYFSNGQLSYQYTKIYSSQQILQNLIRLGKKFYLQPKHFQIINSHIQNEVLQYMLLKYPMTLNHQVSKNVNAIVKEVDHSGQLVNDYLYNSYNLFVLRQTGEYNDLIMRTLNEILVKIETKVKNKTIYQKFEQKMERLFESVTDEDWMKDKEQNKSEIDQIDSYQRLYGLNTITKQNPLQQTQSKKQLSPIRFREREKQKYKQKVLAYTEYKIGKKLPDSMRLFTNQEIASHNIKIENSQTLRILMKWCEQLEKKFKTSNYYELFVQNLKLSNGKSICLVLDDIKICLDQLIAEQKQKIEKQINDLSKNNTYLQSELLMRQLFIKGNSSIQKYERMAASYSIGIVNNLHCYIITYLNRLIHGLLTVANRFSQLPQVSHLELPARINLITFQIFDMLRCKCSSGEKQIIKLYNQVLRLCDGQNMKLVRVINRMKRGTHDILINIRYRDVLCEVQLGVTSTKNQFIEHSNQFNHYLYELKRSAFGPLTQLCSIWKSLDIKFNIYKTPSVKSKLPQNNIKSLLCQDHSYEFYNKPFICSMCDSHCYQSYFIKPHMKCRGCPYWRCAKCQIQHSDCKNLLHAAFKNEQIIQKCTKMRSRSNTVPEYGICIYIQSQQIKVEPFRKVDMKKSNKIFGIKNKHLYEIFDISNDEKIALFYEKYVVFQVISSFGKKHIKIDDDRVRQYIIEQKIKRSFQQNKQKICLNQCNIVDSQLQNLIKLAPEQQRSNIKKIELIGNKIQNLSPLTQQFSSIKVLEVSKNNIKKFEGLVNLQDLQKLYVNNNGISTFPLQICQLETLKQLSMCQNQLSVFPQRLKLNSLKILRLSHNLIQNVPEFIKDLAQLNELNLKNNAIEEIPAFIGTLSKLQILQIQNNSIIKIPPEIEALQNLNSLNLSVNKIKQIPQQISNIKMLTRLNLRNNQLTELPNMQGLRNLSFLDCSNNLFTKMEGLNIPRLIELDLSFNHIENFPHIEIHNELLRTLILGHNRLVSIPSLEYFSNLQILYLNNNQISSICSLYKLQKLQSLILENNHLTHFEELKLEKLKELNISENKLQKFCYMDFKILQELNLAHNTINIFDNNLLPSIRKLNLNNNQLVNINLTSYPKLRYIYVSHNNLISAPEVTDKNQIKTMSLDNNNIKKLQGALLRSNSMNHLNLAFNNIKHIPQELQKMQSLQDRALQLSRNPIETVQCWDFLIKKGTKSTVQQLYSTAVKKKRPYSTMQSI